MRKYRIQTKKHQPNGDFETTGAELGVDSDNVFAHIPLTVRLVHAQSEIVDNETVSDETAETKT